MGSNTTGAGHERTGGRRIGDIGSPDMLTRYLDSELDTRNHYQRMADQAAALYGK